MANDLTLHGRYALATAGTFQQHSSRTSYGLARAGTADARRSEDSERLLEKRFWISQTLRDEKKETSTRNSSQDGRTESS